MLGEVSRTFSSRRHRFNLILNFNLETFMKLSFLAVRTVSYRNCSVLFVALLLWFSPYPALAQTPQSAEPAVENTMKAMLVAIQNNSLPDLVVAGDPPFQNGMTQQILDSIRQSLAPRLKQGYTSTFLAKLKQQGFLVYLWKLEFKDNNDDVLMTVGFKDGKVSGFWLR
jgi:hypothetical protein